MTIYQILCLIGIPSIISGVVGFGIAHVKNVMATNKALKLGLQALLRDRLLQAYEFYTKRGYMTYSERANIKNMYEQYHSLGANGVMDDFIKTLMELKKVDDKNGQRN